MKNKTFKEQEIFENSFGEIIQEGLLDSFTSDTCISCEKELNNDFNSDQILFWSYTKEIKLA